MRRVLALAAVGLLLAGCSTAGPVPDLTPVPPPLLTVTETSTVTLSPPTSTTRPVPVAASRTTAPRRTPRPAVSTARTALVKTPRTVTPGAFCAPAGDVGVTKSGAPMICAVKTGGTRARWRNQ